MRGTGGCASLHIARPRIVVHISSQVPAVWLPASLHGKAAQMQEHGIM